MITIVTPTYNESESVITLLPALAALEGVKEVIVVDDNSPDGTARAAQRLRLQSVTVYIRGNERGLASAIRYGTRRATTQSILVMDSDGQHTPEDASKLIEAWGPGVDLVVGTRFSEGACLDGLPLWRKLSSLLLVTGLQFTLKTKASDPMSGLFLTQKDVILSTRVNGFKILYDILIHHDLEPLEIPINFAKRSGGSSKASARELWEVFKQAWSRLHA